MGRECATRPAGLGVRCLGDQSLGVQRHFETNRLASGFQARAYENVVPVVRRCTTRGAGQDDGDQQPIEREPIERTELVTHGGVAA